MTNAELDRQQEKQDLADTVRAMVNRLDSIGDLDPLEVRPALTFVVLKE
jgi:hypothetical protein